MLLSTLTHSSEMGIYMNRSFIKSDLLFTILVMTIGTLLSFMLFNLVPENSANVVLIYILALIIISRWTKGYRYGIFSALFCVIVVNFCFTYPYFDLNFTLSGYPVTFIEMIAITMLTCTATSQLAGQARIIAERERQLAEAAKEKMRANLLRAISHDIRTPLTSIMGAATTLMHQENCTQKERAELAEHIYDGSEWLLHMVENLLSVTRIQNTANPLKMNPEILEEIVSESVERVRKRYPEASIQVHIPDEMIMLPMDAMLIEQVLINLLENALNHSCTSQPIVLTADLDPANVFLHIIDYGIGIDETEIDHLLNGSFDSSTLTFDNEKGMGIGLSICRTIMDAHNGSITARNHGAGAEFIIRLSREEVHS